MIEYRFKLEPDSIVKIGGIPYKHEKDGMFSGRTNPELAFEGKLPVIEVVNSDTK